MKQSNDMNLQQITQQRKTRQSSKQSTPFIVRCLRLRHFNTTDASALYFFLYIFFLSFLRSLSILLYINLSIFVYRDWSTSSLLGLTIVPLEWMPALSSFLFFLSFLRSLYIHSSVYLCLFWVIYLWLTRLYYLLGCPLENGCQRSLVLYSFFLFYFLSLYTPLHSFVYLCLSCLIYL